MHTSPIHVIGVLAGCLLGFLGAPSASACGTGAVLLQDNFDTLDGWGSLSNDVTASGGMMRIALPPGRFYRFQNQTDFFSDTNICVEMSIVAAGELTTDPFFGLVFWRRQDDYYRFAVAGQGQYFIGRQWNKQTTFPRGWTTAASLKKGLNVWNELEVRTRGHTVGFRLNGVEVARINALQPSGGGLVGFEWTTNKDKAGTVALRNFRIEADDKKGL